jgi:DNA-binding IscR family transcriptional regulator
MNKNLNVQLALMCLQELDRGSSQFQSPAEISRNAGVPLADCQAVLGRLADAGLIERQGDAYALFVPVEDLKVFDILNALSARKESRPAFRWLFGAAQTSQRKTLEAVRWAQALEAFPSDGGWLRS